MKQVIRIPAAVAFATLLACASAGYGADEKQTAMEAAEAYAEGMKGKAPASTVREFWDIDAVLQGIFGDDLKKAPEKDRAEMKRLLTSFYEMVYASPSASLAEAEVGDFEETPGEDGTTDVTFTVTSPARQAQYTLKLKQNAGKWKIVDMASNGQFGVPRIREDYNRQAETVTPMQYVKAMVERGKKRAEERGR